MDKTKFDSFFKPYSKNVDNANQLAFWQLSDKLVEEIIKINIPTDLKDNQVIMDAGGGTGRWICKLSKTYSNNFLLYDLSADMLAQAQKNIDQAQISDRVKIIEGDLIDISAVEDESIDHIVSIYSPISFIYDKEKAFKELYRIIKPGGVIIIMGHSYYNALASKINNYIAPTEEIKNLDQEYFVKWAPHVPKLNTFSKESMEKSLTDQGFNIVKTYGVPVFVQPGGEDFDPENSQKSRISTALEDKEYFKTIFDIEMKHNSEPTVVNRGMNIFTVAKK